MMVLVAKTFIKTQNIYLKKKKKGNQREKQGPAQAKTL